MLHQFGALLPLYCQYLLAGGSPPPPNERRYPGQHRAADTCGTPVCAGGGNGRGGAGGPRVHARSAPHATNSCRYVYRPSAGSGSRVKCYALICLELARSAASARRRTDASAAVRSALILASMEPRPFP